MMMDSLNSAASEFLVIREARKRADPGKAAEPTPGIVERKNGQEAGKTPDGWRDPEAGRAIEAGPGTEAGAASE
jgi:hypothetical protein